MAGHEHLELVHYLCVPAKPKVDLDPLLEDGEPQVVEPVGVGRDERLAAKAAQRRSAPLPERGAEVVACRRPVATPHGPSSTSNEVLHHRDVQLPGLNRHLVARCPGDDGAGRQLAAEARNVGLEGFAGRRGRLLPPHSLDQLAAGDRLAGVEEQVGEDRAAARCGDAQGVVRHRPLPPPGPAAGSAWLPSGI